VIRRRLVVLIFLLSAAAPLLAQSGDDVFVKSVFDRLLTAPTASNKNAKYTAWPPEVGIISAARDGERAATQESMNAFAAAPDCRPIVRISQGLLSQVVQNDENVLALILGHELGHILLGHPPCVPGKDLTSTMQVEVTREQEYAADAKGYEVALAAGYSVRSGLKGLQRLDAISHYSSFEALSVDHPSWTDRLARLDKEQSSLWETMSVYSDGVSFLATENYPLAASCFRAVLHEFPDAADVMGNLGYTLLMQYIDQLRAEDVRAFGIGQIATGSFYGESAALKSKIRGIDTTLWSEAVQSLKAAEQRDNSLSLVKANLGLAYLVQPSGSDPKQALTYLVAASKMLNSDKSMQNAYGDTSARAVLNNTAVAYIAAGDQRSAQNLLQFLWKNQQQITNEQALLQTSALSYNSGALLAASPNPEDQRTAAQILQQYLHMTSPQSLWWKQAYEMYSKVCASAADGCATEAQLRSASRVLMRGVPALDLGGGKSLRLGEPLPGVAARLGVGQPIANPTLPSVKRIRYSQFGTDVIGSDVVLAIVLNGKSAPPLQVRQVGSGSPAAEIRFGMTTDELEKVLADQPYRYEGLLDTWVPYRFYPGIGIAVKVGAQKTVDELVMVRSAEAGGTE
jgi:predicted Zn-dependent protease